MNDVRGILVGLSAAHKRDMVCRYYIYLLGMNFNYIPDPFFSLTTCQISFVNPLPFTPLCWKHYLFYCASNHLQTDTWFYHSFTHCVALCLSTNRWRRTHVWMHLVLRCRRFDCQRTRHQPAPDCFARPKWSMDPRCLLDKHSARTVRTIGRT